MDFNSSEDEGADWESIDFVDKYTSKSQFKSPRIEEFYSSEFRTNTGIANLETSPLIMRMEEAFCTKENMDSRLKYLNQEMAILGFPSILSKRVNSGMDDSTVNFDVIQLINCTHELLKMQQQSMRKRNDLEERQMRSESDYEAVVQNHQRLKQDLESSKREECLSKLRETQLQDKLKKLQVELKNEREEAKKVKNDLQHKYKQFTHEGKRKEKEMVKLKDRLHQLLTDNKAEKTKGMMISNALSRPGGKRGTWKGVNRDEEDMYKVVIARYEDRHKELITENTNLREYLAEHLSEYLSLLQEQYWSAEEKETDTKVEDIKPELLKGHFAMPFDIVREDIQNNFKTAFQVLRERLEQGSSKGSTPANRSPQCDDEKEQLKQQLASCRDVIFKQDELLQDLQEKLLQDQDNSQYQESPRDVENLKERVKLLGEEKENLRLNRRKFTDLAVKLAMEREAFEREKIEFYKSCFSTPMIAAATSKDTNHAQGKPPSGRRMLPTLKASTPVFSPAPHDTNNNSSNKSNRAAPPTPSTTELYRFMSKLAEEKERSRSSVDQMFEDEEGLFGRRKSSSASARSRGGAYEMDKTTPVNVNFFESPVSHRSKRVAEHAEKVKQALENHHRSMEETSPRLLTSEG